MRAQIKRLHSPDVLDLKSYKPDSSNCFGFLLQVMAGPEGGEGEESFDVLVCTPQWLRLNHPPSEIVIGRHHLIVQEYEYGRLEAFLEDYCRHCEGETWQAIAEQLSRLGKWEFEDYKTRMSH